MDERYGICGASTVVQIVKLLVRRDGLLLFPGQKTVFRDVSGKPKQKIVLHSEWHF